MKRNYLSGLGIDSDVIDKILEANNADIEREKEKAANAEEKFKEEIQNLRLKASDAEAELSKAKGESDGEDWKAKYDAEVTAHKATKDGYTAEKEAADIDGKVAAQLKAAGMNEKAIDKALRLYDRSTVERGKDGSIKNADKVVESFKSEWADFFGTVEKQGADIGTPPAAQAAKPAGYKDVNAWIRGTVE